MKIKLGIFFSFVAGSALAINFPLPKNHVAEDYYQHAISNGVLLGDCPACVSVVSNVVHWPGNVQPSVTFTNSQSWWAAYVKAQEPEVVTKEFIAAEIQKARDFTVELLNAKVTTEKPITKEDAAAIKQAIEADVKP